MRFIALHFRLRRFLALSKGIFKGWESWQVSVADQKRATIQFHSRLAWRSERIYAEASCSTWHRVAGWCCCCLLQLHRTHWMQLHILGTLIGLIIGLIVGLIRLVKSLSRRFAPCCSPESSWGPPGGIFVSFPPHVLDHAPSRTRE